MHHMLIISIFTALLPIKLKLLMYMANYYILNIIQAMKNINYTITEFDDTFKPIIVNAKWAQLRLHLMAN